MQNADYLLWVANDAAPLVVLVRGYQQNLLSQFPAFYCYLGVFLGCSILRSLTFLGWGQGSDAYYFVYYSSALLYPVFHLAILWQTRRLLTRQNGFSRRDYLVAGVIFAVLALRIYSRILERYYTVLFTVLSLFVPIAVAAFIILVRAILRERKRIRLGRNVKGILIGVGLMTLVTAINYERIYLLHDRQIYTFLLTFSTLCAGAIWTYALWERDLPRPLSPDV